MESLEYNIEAEGSKLLDRKELWRYRELFYFFTWRDIKVKYKQTVIGLVWVLAQPLLMMAIFTFFFERMLGVNAQGMPYPVFALSGIVFWNFFSAAVTNSGNSMVLNAPIIKKIYFPRLIIPISSILAVFVDFVVALLLFFLFLFFYKHSVNWLDLIIFWPAAFVLCFVGTIGLGCWLSALMVKYRDFRFIIGFAMQIGFFLTPIVYPMNNINFPYLKYLLAVNPIYGAITLFRVPLHQNLIESNLILISAVSAIVMLIAGLSYFRKTEFYFADLS